MLKWAISLVGLLALVCLSILFVDKNVTKAIEQQEQPEQQERCVPESAEGCENTATVANDSSSVDPTR